MSSAVPGAEGKAIFIYNSLFNQITGNLFSSSDLGIHLTAGSEDNRFSGNAFISNKEQVKYVSNRLQDWSHEGRGNYWSDYLGWDLDNDGIGDTHYHPNDGIDMLLWKYPSARVLMNSPAVETLRWVQRQFPVFRPPGVSDSRPLMNSPYPLSLSPAALLSQALPISRESTVSLAGPGSSDLSDSLASSVPARSYMEQYDSTVPRPIMVSE